MVVSPSCNLAGLEGVFSEHDGSTDMNALNQRQISLLLEEAQRRREAVPLDPAQRRRAVAAAFQQEKKLAGFWMEKAIGIAWLVFLVLGLVGWLAWL